MISAAAPDCTPARRALVSTSMVHGSVPRDPDGREVRQALARLHGTDTSSWEPPTRLRRPEGERMTRLLTTTLDAVLDRTVVPGYSKIGYGPGHMT